MEAPALGLITFSGSAEKEEPGKEMRNGQETKEPDADAETGQSPSMSTGQEVGHAWAGGGPGLGVEE